MSTPAAASDRPTLRSFWQDLPREGKYLLSTIIVDFIGNGLVMPFNVVYLHEVRGFELVRSCLRIHQRTTGQCALQLAAQGNERSTMRCELDRARFVLVQRMRDELRQTGGVQHACPEA